MPGRMNKDPMRIGSVQLLLQKLASSRISGSYIVRLSLICTILVFV